MVRSSPSTGLTATEAPASQPLTAIKGEETAGLHECYRYLLRLADRRAARESREESSRDAADDT